MSGGVAYVYDEDGHFAARCNTSMVALEKVPALEEQTAAGHAAQWHRGQPDETILRKLVEDHHRWTGSLRAREILDQWATTRLRFVKVFPHEYKRALADAAARADAAKAVAAARVTADAAAK
jgi:glutamate synthase domain-containing protein 3